MQDHMERLSGSFRLLQKVLEFLEPMKLATDVISAEKHCTASLILPLQHSLLQKTEADTEDPGLISVMKSLFYADLQSR